MGMGTFSGGKFDLIVSIRHDADAARLAEWQASFERASKILFDATDGQHQFGTIYVCNNSTGSQRADSWLHEEDGQSGSPYLGLGAAGLHQMIFGDERFKPYILIHEFGHYAYDLGDEYVGPGGSAECVPPGGDACIMQFGWESGDHFGTTGSGGPLVPGTVSEFCGPSNHDPCGNTNQSHRHHKSCWESMADAYSDLVLPAGSPVPTSTGDDPIQWILLLAEQKFVLVMDRSGSMAGDNLNESKLGADWWVDAAVVGDRVGLVSFSSTVTDDLPIRTINVDADRIDLHRAIAGLVAAGQTSIGGGLRAALNQILGAGSRAANQVIVLLTDGLHNAGEAPHLVLPDLIANGVTVYTVGVGRRIDADLLGRVAHATGGTFYRIDPTLAPDDQAFQIRTSLQEIAGIAPENSGAISSFSEPIQSGQRMRRSVRVEPDAELTTFAISWKNPADKLKLELISPSGQRVAVGQGVRVISGTQPHAGFQILNPEPGMWRMQVLVEQGTRRSDLHFFAFSVNPAIGGTVNSPRHKYKLGEPVPLRLQTYFKQPITNLRVSATVRYPGGDTAELVFRDNGSGGDFVANDGLYHAFLESNRPGVHTIEVHVESVEGRASYPTAGERPDPKAKYKLPPIPPFERLFKTSVLIGRETRPRRRLRARGKGIAKLSLRGKRRRLMQPDKSAELQGKSRRKSKRP